MLTPNSAIRLHLIHIVVNLEWNVMHRFKRLTTMIQWRLVAQHTEGFRVVEINLI
jgi:hypothetical protein